ncbi:MAG: VCBS repeat-containing protein [Verrucomicrobiota bacterium]|nr:VCBS repeat-containing protein [Verrucomicrobiota bacterium]
MKAAMLVAFVVPAVSFADEFAKPVLLEAGGTPVKVESPGYACPSWADWDGDGKQDLLVGQFSKGKIHFFKNEGGAPVPQFRKGEMLLTGKKPAEVPGVW